MLNRFQGASGVRTLLTPLETVVKPASMTSRAALSAVRRLWPSGHGVGGSPGVA